MARNVKISTIGCPNGNVDRNDSWEDAVYKMTDHLKQKISRVLPDRPDLIVLPEVCDIPGNYGIELWGPFIQTRGDRILHVLMNIAAQHSCYIVYPRIKEEEDGTWRNTIELIGRNGEIVGRYNKNHPTISEAEGGVLCGNNAVVLETDFGQVGFVICFDLNFDQLRLQYVNKKPELIVFSSMYHGGLMQQYWAYSCRSYLVSAISHSRPSQIISPIGHVIRTNTNYFDYFTETVNLDYAVCHLNDNWDKLDRLKAKYGDKARFFDPGNLGAILLTCETNDFTVKELIQEFGFEELDDFFARSLSCHNDPKYRET